ncbi:MAG: anthranilate synthase component I family protein [Planctomycetota bacterium]|nr:anthranilate synthase component I family protein [Planctomycetota bacterium]
MNPPKQSVLSNRHAIAEELPTHLEPLQVLSAVSEQPFPVLLDSSQIHPDLGTVSYISCDPFYHETVHRPNRSDLQSIDRRFEPYRCETIPNLPPFQGGIINLCGYDLKRCFENIPNVKPDFNVPDLFAGFYDVVIILDHVSKRNWIVSQGFPKTDSSDRQQRARQRIDYFKQLLQTTPTPRLPKVPGGYSKPKSSIPNLKPTELSGSICSNFTKLEYIDSVQRCIDYIYQGDIFQVNLSQRLLCPQKQDSLAIYQKLRTVNQATFSAYLDLGDHQVLSSSPERLLSVNESLEVETRPIKGTRQRSCYAEANLFAAEGLVTSEKDRSENVMIVDLLRNDLSKICQEDTIHVPTLCGIEPYEFVLHLVSVIRGRLKKPPTLTSIFSALFPGGSITGAPKVRAMEIIAELETVARGPYCGSLGYFGFNGTVDQNILIRTITASEGWLQIPVGGGIVSQSDPASEYEETIHKAHGMLRALY